MSSASGPTYSLPERLQDRLIAFAVGVWKHGKEVRGDLSTTRILDQMVRSATSTAANYAEARSAESRRDFVHKMQICLKELRETRVWLQILKRAGGFEQADELIGECDELTAIFVSSIKTVRRSA